MGPSAIDIKDKIQPNDTIKVAPFKKEIRKTTPHKHNNYFEIIYLSGGSGFHYIDARQFEVKPPVMYFVRREQVHYWELDSEPEGYVIIIKKAFVEDSHDRELKTLFSKITAQSCLYPHDNATIHSLFELLLVAKVKEGNYAAHMLEGLLKALLAVVLETCTPDNNKTGLNSNLYQSFISLLGSEQPIKNKVHYYAELLNTSPQNLNAACRKAIDQPAEEVLAEFMISEAKRLLIYTDKTVAEIAFALDFHDPSHFVKYFKRKSGQTPLNFRRNP
jgi:AraC family transcriptional regulator, transcriptional activator of pobA